MPPRIPRGLLPLKHPVPPPPHVRTVRSRGPQQRPEKQPSQASQPPQEPGSDAPTFQDAPPQNSPPPPSMSNMLAQTSDADNPLLAPVHIPDDPHAVLKSGHPSTNLLAESGIVVQRQIEMMNVFLGFEQANRYVILDPHGNHIGYMAEHEGGIGRSLGRQFFSTHRAFTTNVFDRHGDEVLRFHRPFSYINSRIGVYDPLEPGGHSSVKLSSATAVQPSTDAGPVHTLSQLPLDAMRIIGEAQSEWAPLRRKYNLFLAHDLPSANRSEAISTQKQSNAPEMIQFAYINEPFLSWDFSLKSASDQLLGSVNRSFRGFAREIFTDTGSYALRMDSAGLELEAEKRHIISQSHQGERAYAEALGSESKTGMTLDQRAVMLATAVTVDYDYFSRHSGSGGIMPIPFMMGGGSEGAAAGGAAAGAGAAGAGEVGAAVGGAGRAVGGVTGAAGVGGMGEGAMAGAGTMAGYEAMQRGLGRDQPDQQQPQQQPGPVDDASPQAPQGDYGQQPYDSQSPQSGFGEQDSGQDVWGGDNDPWQGADGGAGAGGGGGEGGGGFFSSLWDAFFGD
ncbi:uncharacterized protein HMPREF1541_10330 [Cyphellophora europaea CBS 101466]|uniref:Scramblase-domain-containing protein n=1 Tax=Cyphellophora europaea (strain CBS 101466) TaxID=1220924 RepID=W2S7Q1_CYPE1|nr:uncharacterized protein HMPREF1541_10330 [Cyphellophora europaea CBS 101466]ETN44660.1 hypothetical protein HMPREF1541_10330 [Cyphellophora europaea CBS 101466]